MGYSTLKTFMLLTSNGPLVILTSYEDVTAPGLLGKLKAKGITKFLAFDIPPGLARKRYGGHFFVVEHDLHDSDDLRVLDYNGSRAFSLFSFEELGQPIAYEEKIAEMV